VTVIFLIGGIGNQLFQFADSEAGDRFSVIFTSKPVRWALGWTQHEQFFRFKAPSLSMHALALSVLALDFGLVFATGRSLFTEFDLRSIKAKARLQRLVKMGYAQDAPGSRDLGPIVSQIGRRADLGPCSVVLHIRGGDLAKLEAQGYNTYGMLRADYYQAALSWAKANLKAKGQRIKRAIIITDDPDHAAAIAANLSSDIDLEIAQIPLVDTFRTALSAEYYLSSNSTMSYWILLMRKGVKSVAPYPFMKRGDMHLPEATERVPASYSG